MTEYNGWTNYATWRINLEIFDGLDPKDMGWARLDVYDMGQAAKEYANEILEQTAQEGLALDYARAFISDVNWQEIARHFVSEYEMDEEPFHVVGIDEDDGSATILEQFDNSGEARQWMLGYVAKENAGNWKQIQVLDTREECAEIIWKWEAEGVEA